MEVDGELRAIHYGNATTLAWVASENSTDRKLKKAIRRTITRLVRENHERYIAKLEAERLGRE